MVLKLYGAPLSTCTRYVAVVLKEKEIDFVLVKVDLAKREQKAPGFIANHPFGQVPYIDDDGFILYESRAIARYLVKKYPSKGTQGLIPGDLKEEALFEQAASVEVANFNAYASIIAYEKFFKVRSGGKTDEARVAEAVAKLDANLGVYETILSKQKYLAGENVTLADLQHLAYGSVLFATQNGQLITSKPSVHRWWNDISNRQSWQAVKDGVQ